MIPVISEPRRDGLTSFDRLGRYLTKERSKESGEVIARGPIFISSALLSVDTAILEMKSTASQNARVGDPILHFQISWREGEVPVQSEWQESAERSIAALGFADHQYIVVAHDDTDNFHVHVMLNRVHPDTYSAPNPRMSQLALHRTARELEQTFGRQEDHGLYRWDKQLGRAVRTEKDVLITTRQNAERPKGGEVSLRGKMERFNDQESVRAFAADKPARALRQLFNSSTASWPQVHALLGRYGLEMQAAERGGFTVNVENSQIKVKASDVFRFAFSGRTARTKTDTLLGPFAPLSPRSPLLPPVVDYSTNRALSRNTYAKPVSQPGFTAARQGAAPQTINNLRSLSSLHVVRAVEVDKMFLHRDPRADVPVRRTDEHFGVRRGSASQPQAPRRGGEGLAAGVSNTTEERKAAWRRKMDDEARERRQTRLRERQKDRQELKAEFQAARGQHRAGLHGFTTTAGERRASLRAAYLAEKSAIRQGPEPWVLRKAYLSQRTAEYLIARQQLSAELTITRQNIKRATYEEWIEEKAAGGDKRATAQLRGWKYQDRRNVRKLDAELPPAQSRSAGRFAGDPETYNGRLKQELDWEVLGNDRIRQLREGRSIPALEHMKWRANATSGDVTYTVSGTAALVDRGKQITVLQHDPVATGIALEMAIHKYGRTIEAKGSDVFQSQLIQAAVRQNVDVVFTDPQLQARLVAARARQYKQQERNKQRGGQAERGV